MNDPSPANPLGDRAIRVDPGPAGGDLSRLQDDQRRRWACGEQVLVEDYLTAFAGVLRDPDALLEILYHEVLVREEFGDAPELDEYLRRFPRLARQIRDQFEIHSALKSNQWLTKAGSPGLADATTLTDSGGRAAGAGPSIPGYEVIRELGRGGMGVVYLAWQIGLGRLVALKMIRAGEYSRPQDLARFRSEAEAVARLEHPNIVKIYEIGEDDGCPYFSMEYVDSGRPGRLPPRHALASTAGGRTGGDAGPRRPLRPRAGRGPPRPDPQQRAVEGRRSAQDRRLRPGQAPGRRRGPYGERGHPGDTQLHRPRAGLRPKQGGRAGGRRLCARGDPL